MVFLVSGRNIFCINVPRLSQQRNKAHHVFVYRSVQRTPDKHVLPSGIYIRVPPNSTRLQASFYVPSKDDILNRCHSVHKSYNFQSNYIDNYHPCYKKIFDVYVQSYEWYSRCVGIFDSTVGVGP